MSKSSRQLQEIYALVPDIECKGMCFTTCHHIAMSSFEGKRIEREHGPILATDSPCPHLVNTKCGIYKDRPLICRLWGVVDHPLMTCKYGCKPKKYMTNDQSRALLARALTL